MLKFYRIFYVLLGAMLGAVAGYLIAKYFVMFFGIALHLYAPERYSFEHVMAVLLDTRSWLRPLLAGTGAAYAAAVCYRFARRPAQAR